MKIHINVKIESNAEANSKLDLAVDEEETVSEIKSRIGALQLIPFPSQDLMLNGEVLADGDCAADCGVKEQTSLDLVVRASRATVVEQLSELLQARDLSCDELSLLYRYRHGVGLAEALAMVGCGERLPGLVERESSFQLRNNLVTLVRDRPGPEPFTLAAEVAQILGRSPYGTMEIKDLCAKFRQKFRVSLSALAGMRPTEYLASEQGRFVVCGGGIVSLRTGGDSGRPPTPPPADARPLPEPLQRAIAMARVRPQPGDPSAEPVPGESASPSQAQFAAAWGRPVAGQAAAFTTPKKRSEDAGRQVLLTPPPGLLPIRRGAVVDLGAEKEAVRTPPNEPADAATDLLLAAAGNEQYVDLHNKICSRAFFSKITQTLREIVEAITEIAFLNVARIAKGGSVCKGTAIAGLADAEVVFFLSGLPRTGHDRWLPPLLRAVAGVLTESLGEGSGLEDIHATEDSVQLSMRGLVVVDLRFSPVFESYAQVIQTLGEQGPEARRFFGASLVEERVQFIARQPWSVKTTIRLLKWWRDQQAWSSRLVRPTDELLELAAVYSAVQSKPSDQREAIANVMGLLSRFNELRIVWSNFYDKSDVWAPLLRQRPLLMDPVNPFVNVADPQAFDARELMEVARGTRFFW